MTDISTERAHATVVAISGRGVMIEGLSGSGKSDLALRLIDRGATLVSDDQVLLTRDGSQLIAAAPPTIAGKIEVRGLGLLDRHHRASVPVALIIHLDGTVERLPETPAHRTIAGIAIPVVPLAAFEGSAPIKVELALQHFGLRV